MSIDQALLYYGTALASSAGQTLRAGLLKLDLIDGGLRNICYAGHEVLRAINYVVRDKDWGTYAPQISNLQITQQTDAFNVTYTAKCMGDAGQLLHYSVRIAGNAKGVVQFDAIYKAASDFLTCRTGFCVLHPINGLAGEPVLVTHADGGKTDSLWPRLIEPWQPFKDIRAITHQVAPGLQASCCFEGGVFEMEDQRNWSDASFKTYVRPLALPWPYLIAAGASGAQAVRLQIDTLAGQVNQAGQAPASQCVITLRPSAMRLPRIGIAIAPEEIAATLANLDHLCALGPQILLCHYDPAAGHTMAALSGFAALARAHHGQYILECVLPGGVDPGAELSLIKAQLAASGFKPDGVAVCPSVHRQSVPPGSAWPPCPDVEHIYAAARLAFPGLRLGGGMFSYFTELNRKRPPFEQLDWITHSTNPIVHAADDVSVMQTLEALPHITASCRAMIGTDTPYWIGPVTLAMRQNPYGSRTLPNPANQRMPMAASDPRQRALFGAAWLLGYAAQIAGADLEVLTLGGLAGPRGAIGHVDAQAATPFQRYPVFHVMAGLAQLAGASMLECHSTQPRQLLAIGGIDQHGQTSLWIANLCATVQSCRLEGMLPPGRPSMQVLNEYHWNEMSAPADQNDIYRIELLPYSCMHFLWPPVPHSNSDGVLPC